jgi:hypothetical protein
VSTTTPTYRPSLDDREVDAEAMLIAAGCAHPVGTLVGTSD